MQLGFIGMSGVGKTYWARRLAAAGFRWVDCDTLLAARLRANGLTALQTPEDVGAWLGMPYEAGYPEREAQFIGWETAMLEDILAELAHPAAPGDNLVVDMGGSVIYAGAALFAELRRFLTIVYLEITPAVHEQMLQAYLARPLSLIWRGVEHPPGQTFCPETIGEDYRRLIAFRESLYAAFCDVRIPYAIHRRPEWPAAAFLAQVRQARLPQDEPRYPQS